MYPVTSPASGLGDVFTSSSLRSFRCRPAATIVCRGSGGSTDATLVFRTESWGLKANGTSARAKSAPTIGKIHRIGSIR
jgi:hypothetical protein